MREIEFRGQEEDTGEIVFGSLIVENNKDTFIVSKFTSNVGNCEKFNLPRMKINKVFSNTVAQYTGKKDKNGNKIFEGDLVRQSNSIGVIKFFDDSFKIEWIKDNDFYSSVLSILHSSLEIFGIDGEYLVK